VRLLGGFVGNRIGLLRATVVYPLNNCLYYYPHLHNHSGTLPSSNRNQLTALAKDYLWDGSDLEMNLPEPGNKLLETLWKIGINCLIHLDNSVYPWKRGGAQSKCTWQCKCRDQRRRGTKHTAASCCAARLQKSNQNDAVTDVSTALIADCVSSASHRASDVHNWKVE